MSDLNSSITRLRQINLQLRSQLELAEARIPEINDLIRQLAAIELIPETVLLGLVIYQGHYNARSGPHDSGPVLQSALLIPGGLGVIYWDSEEYLDFRRQPEPDLSIPFLKWIRFEECGSAIKALLLPQVGSLLELLLNRFHFPETN